MKQLMTYDTVLSAVIHKLGTYTYLCVYYVHICPRAHSYTRSQWSRAGVSAGQRLSAARATIRATCIIHTNIRATQFTTTFAPASLLINQEYIIEREDNIMSVHRHRSGNNKQFLALITSGDIRDPFHTHTCAIRDTTLCTCVRAGDKRSPDNPPEAADAMTWKLCYPTV